MKTMKQLCAELNNVIFEIKPYTIANENNNIIHLTIKYQTKYATALITNVNDITLINDFVNKNNLISSIKGNNEGFKIQIWRGNIINE